MTSTLQREWRVAFSRRVQPTWFRIVKWTVFLGLAVVFRRSPRFWRWAAGLSLLGALTHLFYRWQTEGWTRPWGGWSDLESSDR